MSFAARQSPAPLYDPSEEATSQRVNVPYDPPTPSQLPSPSLSPAPQLQPYKQPDAGHLYSQPHPHLHPGPSSGPAFSVGGSRPNLRRNKASILDELLPTPTSFSSSHGHGDSGSGNPSVAFSRTLRRAGAVAVISIFLLSMSFMASTAPSSSGLARDAVVGSAAGLRKVFGVGNQAELGGWVSQEVTTETGAGGDAAGQSEEAQGDGDGAADTNSDTDSETEPVNAVRPDVDFDKYKMLMTLPPEKVDVTTRGKRMIFIGDVHGSFDPLVRLMNKISYDPTNDRLIHVGDLVAKGSKHEDVLWWMNERRVMGVRGNHDQAVIQWRAWMEWAGGQDWEAYVDSLAAGDDEGVASALGKEGKTYPNSWKWKGEHWKIARTLPKRLYLYLLDLPLVLHLPSLHTLVVHAGVLPHDPLQPPSSPVQPLVQFSNSSLPGLTAEAIRNSEEVSILFDIPQNSVPWNLLNMRGVYTHGKKRGKVTKSGKKGTPWSDVWKKQMSRCQGLGKWSVDGMGESSVEQGQGQLPDETVANEEDEEVDEVDKNGVAQPRQKPGTPAALEAEEEEGQLGCSPITVIYGHAAGRGLDIKPFSKGLDTGAVYGRQLMALILGDLAGTKGKTIRVGDHQGVLVSEDCGEGGT